MPDSFVETTSTSWLSRIVGLIAGVLFGIVFVIGSIVLLFWNEGRAVQTARSLSEGGKVVVDAAPAPVDPGNEGRLVHVTGDAKAGAPIADPTFVVSAPALRLVRAAEMYQWQEDKREETHKSIGGSEQTVTTYTYKKVWLVAAGIVIALAWFWYRPLVGIAVLAVGLFAGIALHRLAGRRRAAPAGLPAA